MPVPKKYPDELRARATRMAVEARQDPATAGGALARIADQLGIHREALREHQDDGPAVRRGSGWTQPSDERATLRDW